MSDNYIIVRSTSGKAESGNKVELLLREGVDMNDEEEDFAPGSRAYTADLSVMQMKDPDGAWKTIGG